MVSTIERNLVASESTLTFAKPADRWKTIKAGGPSDSLEAGTYVKGMAKGWKISTLRGRVSVRRP
jgi:hypothetical protein